jgi:hypothetical protein
MRIDQNTCYTWSPPILERRKNLGLVVGEARDPVDVDTVAVDLGLLDDLHEEITDGKGGTWQYRE